MQQTITVASEPVPSHTHNFVLQARGLVKIYEDQPVVDGIDLTIVQGECFGLLGPNGAGKTTTLRMLLGLTPPDAGTLEVLGHAVPAQARVMRERVGIVPQQDNLDPDFSVWENLATYGNYFGLRGAQLHQRIEELLQFASLQGREQSSIQSLSGGMKRRLTLARALINDPDLVVLDEPTTGLDPQARQHIWERLRSLLRLGRTLILTTHYMEEAERLCDRIAIMDHGRIVDCDSPQGLIERHIEPHVAELRGERALRLLTLEPQGVRIERVGETVLLYAQDRDVLQSLLAYDPDLSYLYRPADLEDVFLRLTGRDLRD
jgi:lipooligosaccharide transport system ATP-binding protein